MKKRFKILGPDRQKSFKFMFMKPCAPNRCEPSIEVMKMVSNGGSGFGGCQGGCEREERIEVVKIKKKIGGGGQVRVDVNEELKLL